MALVGGAAAFPHCLGMCGGFALHLASDRRATALGRQALWHLGRTSTYVFLGALAGYLGRTVSLSRWPAVKDVPGYLAGALMVVMGLVVLGVFPVRGKNGVRNRLCEAPEGPTGKRFLTPFFPKEEGPFTALFLQFFQRPSSLSALVLGLATGFLPCPITVGFLGLAAGTASVPLGMGIMASMGVGTVWALLVLGMTGHAIKARWKARGAVLVGLVLVLMGAWTLLRKTRILPPLPNALISAPSSEPAKSCCQPGR